MLHIVLPVLKIIGIILAILLGLIMIAGGIVFFVPLKYYAYAEASGEIDSIYIIGKFSWLLHIFSGEFVYQDKQIKGHVKILWRELQRKKGEGKKKKEKKRPEKMSFWQKIKYTFKKICDMIKKCRENHETLTEFVADEIHLSAWRRIKQEIVRVLYYIKPKKIRGEVTFGFDDPSVTGKTLAILSMLYPFYGDNIQITPDFENQILEGEAHIHGKIRGIYAFIIAKNLFFDKDFMRTIKDIQKWKG